MLNLNKCTKTKPKLKPKNCCAYHRAQLPYTKQNKTVLIIFPLILQTIATTQMMSTGGQGEKGQITDHEMYSTDSETRVKNLESTLKVSDEISTNHGPRHAQRVDSHTTVKDLESTPKVRDEILTNHGPRQAQRVDHETRVKDIESTLKVSDEISTNHRP